MKTMNIKGKEYITVNERVKHFRTNDDYKGFTLRSDILSVTDSEIIIKAVVRDAEDRIISEGIAHEVAGSCNVNKTSHVENCETSAWGRALGNLGIGIDTSIASYDEINNAVVRQEMNSKASNTPSKPVSNNYSRTVAQVRQRPSDNVLDHNEQSNITQQQNNDLPADKTCNECGKSISAKMGKNGSYYHRCFNCGIFL